MGGGILRASFFPLTFHIPYLPLLPRTLLTPQGLVADDALLPEEDESDDEFDVAGFLDELEEGDAASPLIYPQIPPHHHPHAGTRAGGLDIDGTWGGAEGLYGGGGDGGAAGDIGTAAAAVEAAAALLRAAGGGQGVGGLRPRGEGGGAGEGGEGGGAVTRRVTRHSTAQRRREYEHLATVRCGIEQMCVSLKCALLT